MVRQVQVGGRTPVEMAVGIVLILLSALIMVVVVRTVQANMPR